VETYGSGSARSAFRIPNTPFFCWRDNAAILGALSVYLFFILSLSLFLSLPSLITLSFLPLSPLPLSSARYSLVQVTLYNEKGPYTQREFTGGFSFIPGTHHAVVQYTDGSVSIYKLATLQFAAALSDIGDAKLHLLGIDLRSCAQ